MVINKKEIEIMGPEILDENVFIELFLRDLKIKNKTLKIKKRLFKNKTRRN